MKIFKNNKGLTIIELLAVIIVMCLLVGITVMVILNIVRKVRLDSYKVTINEVESNANEYVIENSDHLIFVSDEVKEDEPEPVVEYQCITVQNLIDYGYLDNNVIHSAVSDNDTVHSDSSVYVERNKLTKAITKKEFVTSTTDEVIQTRCGKVAIGEITFSVNPETWARSKTITINYKVYNINDVNKLNDIKYTYTYEGDPDSITNVSGDEHSTTRTVRVTSEKKLTASIIYNNHSLKDESITPDKIDNIGPTITLDKNTTQIVRNSVSIPIVIDDVGIGADYSTVEKEDFVVTIDNKTTTNFTLTENGKDSGKYNINITEEKESGKVTIVIDSNKIRDLVDNGNKKTTLKTNTEFNNNWTVKFDANGGVKCDPLSKTYKNGDKLGTICSTTLSGNELVGWFTSKDGGTEVTSNTIVKKSMTIYAHWKPIKYTIKYDSNGGSTCNQTSFTKNHGEKYGTLCTPTKAGNTFEGWWTAKTGGINVNENTEAYEDRTLYARWTAKEIKITFDCNGGTGGGTKTYTYGADNQSFPSTSLCTRSGYAGTKWTWDKEGSNGNFQWTSYSVTNDWIDANSTGDTTKTVYAQWNALTYTIKYDSNGGSACNPNSFTKTYGQKYGTLCSPTKAGNKFEGWYTAKSGGTQVNKDTEAYEDRTIYAHWTAKKITINFDCNGGTGGGTKTYTHGIDNQTFPSTSLCTRSGFTGTKWTWDKEGSNGNFLWTNYSVTNNWIDTNSTGDTTKTVYAQWNPDPIYFDDKEFNKPFSTSQQSVNIVSATGGSGSYTYTEQSEKNASGDSTNHINISGKKVNIDASTPPDTYKVVIKATDSNTGATATATYTITIGVYETKNGGNLVGYYNGLSTAYSKITSNEGQIKALTDYTDPTSLNVASGKKILLDLNNKTITFRDNGNIQNSGDLRLQYAGTINCNNLAESKNCIVLNSNGIIYLNNLTITSTKAPIIKMLGGKVEMNSGTTLSTEKYAVVQTGGEFYQFAGTITSTTSDYAISVGAEGLIYGAVDKTAKGRYFLYAGTVEAPNGGGFKSLGGGWVTISRSIDITHKGEKAYLYVNQGTGVINDKAKITANNSYILEEAGGNVTIEHNVNLVAKKTEALYFTGGWANIPADNTDNKLTIKNETTKKPLITVTGDAQLTLEGSTTSTYYTPSSKGILVVKDHGIVHISQRSFEFDGTNPFVTVEDDNAEFRFGNGKGASSFQVTNKHGTFVVLHKGKFLYDGGTIISRNGGIILTMKGGEITMSSKGSIEIHNGKKYSDVIVINGGNSTSIKSDRISYYAN